MNIVKSFNTDGVNLTGTVGTWNNLNTEMMEAIKTGNNIHLDASGDLYIIPYRFFDSYDKIVNASTLQELVDINRDVIINMLNLKVADNSIVTYSDLLNVTSRENLELSTSMEHIRAALSVGGLEEVVNRFKPIKYINPEAIARKRIRVGEEYPRYNSDYCYELGDITVDNYGSNPLIRINTEWVGLDDDVALEYLSQQEQQLVEHEEPQQVID